MVHAYHTIFGAYGFWLPNDPRGSWSDFVGAWELARFGTSTKSLKQMTGQPEQQHNQAKDALKYPAVQFTGAQARAVGRGFASGAKKSSLNIWACSILPTHVHLVIARHTFGVEQIVTLLKGEATKQLKYEALHPLAQHTSPDGRTPTSWARGEWKSFLDSEEAIEAAIRYVVENPTKEDKPRQVWPFVTPFTGLDRGWVTYY